jgi:large subunit ribosomal protein L28
MARCDLCGKGPQFGHNVSHSKRRTNRMWRPNIQKTTIYEGNRKLHVHVCVDCLRTLKKV